MASPTRVLTSSFHQRFPGAPEPSLYRAPGRVNLIGEHTDYNLGYVMPIALDMACFTAWAPSDDGMLRVFSENPGESREWPVDSLMALEKAGDWTDYVIGVARELVEAGYPVHSGRLFIESTVPVGAGLSSSASLEVATALALLAGRKIAPIYLVRVCHRAENKFVGMPCGVMDQYISVFGREGAAIEIDCRTLQQQPVLLPAGVEIIAVNSMVKHELGTSAYRQRVAECQAAVAALQQRSPLVKSLRDANESHLEILDGAVLKRARHVITEIARVRKFVQACEAEDRVEMGKQFVASHRSLQHDYEVSCEELDFLVDTAIAMPHVYGARMTGGGFGGCTVNLVESGASADFEKEISGAYQTRFGIAPQIYHCKPSAGAGPL